MENQDIEPGAGSLGFTGYAPQAFRKRYEELREGYARAARALYRQPAADLPPHYGVLAAAKQYLEGGMHDVALIMSQTACEMATDYVITTLLERLRVPLGLNVWIDDVTKLMSTLKDDRLYKLYLAVTGGDKVRDASFWQAYTAAITIRNEIVHKGAHATEAQATDACATADKLLQHFESILAK